MSDFNFYIGIETINAEGEEFTRETLDYSKWKTMFLFLSLDYLEPYWKYMGLELERFPEIKKMIQDHEYISTAYMDINPPTQYPEDTWAKRYKAFFDEIESQFGYETAEKLYLWGLKYFRDPERKESKFSCWDSLMERMYYKPKDIEIAPMALDEKKVNLIKEKALEIYSREGIYEQVYEKVDDYSQFSTRDREILDKMKIHLEIFDDDDDDDYYPVETISSVIVHHKAVLLFDFLSELLTEDEFPIVQEWAKAQETILNGRSNHISDYLDPR